MSEPPLVVHVIHHLVIGGLENGLVNLINHMPDDRYRHAIVCMDSITEFRNRIEKENVPVCAVNKKPGKDFGALWRLRNILRQMRPAIVHSRNLSGLDGLIPAMLAGVRCRIHGEHGWHDDDPRGENPKYRLVRKVHRPFVKHYVALSEELERYLNEGVGVAHDRITRIINGVDTRKFRPKAGPKHLLTSETGWSADEITVMGTVGRIEEVKDPMNLAMAFVRLLEESPELASTARLAIIGDGSHLPAVKSYLRDSGVESLCWLPGARQDIADILSEFDLYVLPSKGEGISNTILEAMACGLPVVATTVGGNSELVDDGNTGTLVPPSNPQAMSEAIAPYIVDRCKREEHGGAGRKRAEDNFSLDVMIDRYIQLYDRALQSNNA